MYAVVPAPRDTRGRVAAEAILHAVDHLKATTDNDDHNDDHT